MRRSIELYLPIGPKCLDKNKDTKDNPRFLNTFEEPEFLRHCVKKDIDTTIEM